MKIAPARLTSLHRNRSEIRRIFLDEMSGVDPDLTDDPAVLAGAAREHLDRGTVLADFGTLGGLKLAGAPQPARLTQLVRESAAQVGNYSGGGTIPGPGRPGPHTAQQGGPRG